MTHNRLSLYSWGVLTYTILVILWGAFVRASGAGAGCGNHWPLCNGAIVPRPEQIETVIEFTHRAMTGLLLPIFIILAWLIYRRYPGGHRIRWSVSAAGLLLIIESLIGAGLVRFELVADNVSVARALSIALHLVNTYFLLAALALTAWWSRPGSSKVRDLSAGARTWISISLAGMVLLGATGAVTALGDTLFPATSLVDGLRQDLAPTANFLIRLRVWHPVLAVLVSLITLNAVRRPGSSGQETDPLGFLRRGVISLIALQLTVGVVNVALLAPIWVQITHLLIADLLWVFLVIYSSEVLLAARASDALPASQIQHAARS